jgi:integrase
MRCSSNGNVNYSIKIPFTSSTTFSTTCASERLAPTTVHKRLQFARMFFRGAKKRKLIGDNPFAEVTAKATQQDERKYSITRDETDKLLAVCDLEWRVIVALARYGGLRCPSEVLSLRWEDIDWQGERIVVQSPKTEHHPGKGNRTIPLFPELLPILLEAKENAEAGGEFVAGEDRRKAALGKNGWRNYNLGTQLKRLIRRAGHKPWPRILHHMRGSRETELAAEHPLHVVTAWLGNTPRIAIKHYLHPTDADFKKATAGGAGSGAKSGATVGCAIQQPAARNDATP